VVVTDQCSREDIPAFYDVLQETCKRDGFGVRAISYYYDIWDLLIERGLGAMFLGRSDEQVICGALTFAAGTQAWYVYGASSNSHRNLMPNHLMQWEMMKWAQRRGCSVYDMRGVAREAAGGDDEGGPQGLNRFKRGFGARYMEYIGEFDLVYSPLWYGLFNLAERMRLRGR
jgi:peptidoglycan pentaglycine glycine transferase (the first glycine)